MSSWHIWSSSTGRNCSRTSRDGDARASSSTAKIWSPKWNCKVCSSAGSYWSFVYR